MSRPSPTRWSPPSPSLRPSEGMKPTALPTTATTMPLESFLDEEFVWSHINESPANVEKLHLLCHSAKELKKGGYVMEQLSPVQIQAKTRCLKCGKRVTRRFSPKQNNDKINDSRRIRSGPGLEFGLGRSEMKLLEVMTTCYNSQTEAEEDEKFPKPRENHSRPLCAYHTGGVMNKTFTCCGRHVSKEGEGCVLENEHTLPRPNDRSAIEYWEYHPTPPTQILPVGAPSSHASRGARRRRQIARHQNHVAAISLDCEMGISRTGETELIRLTAIDFFSGTVLIDALVSPSVPMKHFNTRYSGVSARDMREAVRYGTAIHGRDAARQLLLEYVGPETVVVVHGGQNDFTALRWIHPCIVDTFILEGYVKTIPATVAMPAGDGARGGVGDDTGSGGQEQTQEGQGSRKSSDKPQKRSLQHLCMVKLGLAVQGNRPGKRRVGHDSYEDAMACRELVVDWFKMIPDA